MRKFCLFVILSIGYIALAIANAPHTKDIPIDAEHIFEENKGQLPEHVLFKADLFSRKMFVEQGKIKWHLMDKMPHLCSHQHTHKTECEAEHHTRSFTHHVFDMIFLNSNEITEIEKFEKNSYPTHYLKGDSTKWARDVHIYKGFQLKSLYEGIDLKMYSAHGHVKYDFIVDAGEDYRQIEIAYKGVDSIQLINGDLYIFTQVDTLIEKAPYVYQSIEGHRKEIPAKFILDSNKVRFDIGAYNQNYDLIIDPELIFSTYSGSRSDNWGFTATPGLNGELFAGGVVFGTVYNAIDNILGSFISQFNPGNLSDPRFIESDIALYKFDPTGTRLEYFTYLGGNNSETPHSLIVNSRNELVIYGVTASTDFPTSSNAVLRNLNATSSIMALSNIPFVFSPDIYVTVLSQNGNNLVGSTLIGGDGADGVDLNFGRNYGDVFRGEVIVDESNNIYVASSTNSDNFHGTRAQGGTDAVVFSLNRTCSSLRFVSRVGGNDHDVGYGLKRRPSSGDIYLVGSTRSNNLPNTGGALEPRYLGNNDGYLSRISANGSILRTTYIGTSEEDNTMLIDIDEDENIFITGQTFGRITPSSPNVYNNANSGQYIYKINPQLSRLLLSTVIGSGDGNPDLSLTAFLVDECGRVYLAGWGDNLSPDAINVYSQMPLTSDAYQRNTDGSDFYFIVLEEDFRRLIFATYFGRNDNPLDGSRDHVDGGTSRFDNEGVVYHAFCAGCQGFSDFPTTPGAFSNTNNSRNCNLAAMKMDFQLDEIFAQFELALDTFGCAPYNAEFRNLSINADSFLWDFGNGMTSSEINPSTLYDTVGKYQGSFIAISFNSCIDSDTIPITIDVIPAPEVMDSVILECDLPEITLSSSRLTPNAIYEWNNGQNTPTIAVSENGQYEVLAEESNCQFIDRYDLTIITAQPRLMDMNLCGEDSITLQLDPRAENIRWNTGNTTPTQFVDENGVYTVSYDVNICKYQDTGVILFPSIPEFRIDGPDRACANENATLRVVNESGANIQDYNWFWVEGNQNVSNENTYSVQNTGTYRVNVLSDSMCSYQNEKYIFIVPLVPEQNIPDTTICADGELVVSLNLYDSVQALITWHDERQDVTRRFTTEGNYRYRIQTECQDFTDDFQLSISPFSSTDEPFYVPNIFSPNQDQINDVLVLKKAQEMQINDYHMQVFDRWGNEVFESRDYTRGWDGAFRDLNMSNAVYAFTLNMVYFICEAPKEKRIRGDVTIFK